MIMNTYISWQIILVASSENVDKIWHNLEFIFKYIKKAQKIDNDIEKKPEHTPAPAFYFSKMKNKLDFAYDHAAYGITRTKRTNHAIITSD